MSAPTNWNDYFQDSLKPTRVGGRLRDEIVAKTCPFCSSGSWKFYVNIGKRRFRCYRATCDAHGSFVDLVQQIEQLGSYREAMLFIKRNLMKQAETMDTLHALLDAVGIDDGDVERSREVEPMPTGFKPCYGNGHWSVPRYAKERGIAKESIKKHRIGYCTSGRYANRLIIPVRCDGNQSFVARDMIGESDRKYLNPPSIS